MSKDSFRCAETSADRDMSHFYRIITNYHPVVTNGFSYHDFALFKKDWHFAEVIKGWLRTDVDCNHWDGSYRLL